MKYARYSLFLFLLAIFFGCTDKQKLEQLQQDKAQLEAEYNELAQKTAQKDSILDEYTTTVNEVFDNLENIRKREGLILRLKDKESVESASTKERLLSNISSIDSHIKNSRQKLNQLRSKIDESGMQLTSLNETIENLTQTLDEKEKQISELRSEVEKLNVRVAEMEGTLQEKTERLNTGFYIVGNEKELKDKGIIVEKGGILGIRQTKKLADNFSDEHFVPVDITETGMISVNDKINDINIISPHDPNSYQLAQTENGEAVLEILDPQEFWKIRYLVVLTK